MKNILASAVLTVVCLSVSAFETSTPEAQGVSSAAVLEWVGTLERELDAVHGFVLVRHGKIIAEGWWAPYAKDSPHMLFSLSKSFTSTAIGLAVDDNKLILDERIANIFPDKLPEHPNDNLLRMRVRDLLCMASGGRDTISAMAQRPGEDWVKTFLSCPVEFEPSTHFFYNTGATYVLSAIATKAESRDLLDLLNERVFGPLGIEGATWAKNPQGIRTGGYGLNLKTRDIAAFGQLLLQRGIWNGQRLISDRWISQATTKQISNGTNPSSDWAQGYCFQFWRCRHNAFRGDGAFGQYCIVMPDQDVVLAINAGLNDMQKEISTVWNHLLPAFKGAALPEDAAANAALTQKLASLSFAPLAPKDGLVPSAQLGKTFALTDNAKKIEAVTLAAEGAGWKMTFENNHGLQNLAIGSGKWEKGSAVTEPEEFDLLGFPPGEQKTAVSGAWISPDTFRARIVFYETPFIVNWDFHFAGDDLKLDIEYNVSFGMRDFHLTGKSR